VTQKRRNPGTESRATSTTPIADRNHTQPSDRKPGTALVWIPCTRPPAPQDARSTIQRRRAAANRSVPLDCGCRDPWTCRCTEPPLSEKQINAGRAAALHILECGGVPLIEFEILRALWKRGGEDRELAEALHTLTGGEIG
jgi:hypothetical protein